MTLQHRTVIAPEAVPAELRALTHWVVWAYRKQKEGRLTKRPYQARNPQEPASSTDPATWATFDEALALYERNSDYSNRTNQPWLSGIGIALTKEMGLVGIDLDDVYNPETGELAPWAKTAVSTLDTYTEISPGGRGLRLFAKGTLEHLTGRKRGDAEVYTDGRYLTITGNHLPGTPQEINEAQTAIDALHAEHIARPELPQPTTTGAPRVPVSLDDDTVLQAVFNSRNGPRIKALWGGDTSAHEGDHSSADLALCGHLAFFCDYDPVQVDRLFRSSGLMRPKWDEPRGDMTYGQRTITEALTGKRPGDGYRAGSIRLQDAARAKAAGEPERPEIVTNDRFLRDIVDDSLDALNEAHGLYLRAQLPVRLEGDRAKPLTHAALKGELERTADFVKVTWKPGEDGEQTRTANPSRPPGDVVADILSLPPDELPFPPLNAITPTPILTPEGRIHHDGYDPETGILVTCRLNGLRSDMPVSVAVGLLNSILSDFPFTDAAGKAHWYAMTLQPIVRHVIRGATPLYGVEAPTRGTGKGLIVDVSTIITTGGSAPIMPNVRDADELDKRTTTLLLEGASHILLDNVLSVRSGVLAAALTSEVYRGRILGKSESVDLPNHAVWIFTGNNPDVSDEIARRIMPIRLDPGVERPEERTGFKHPRLKEHVRKNRAQLLSAALSIVNAWALEGQPLATISLGSFESWASIMGGILEVAGIPGLLGGREHLHELADLETREWAAVLEAWQEEFGENPITAGELFNDLLQPRSLLINIWGGRSKIAGQQRIGHALKARRDRVFGKYRLTPAGLDGATRNAAYKVTPNREPTSDPEKTPETPRNTQHAVQHAKTARVFSEGQNQNTRTNTQNTRTEPKNTRTRNTVQDGINTTPPGVPGVSGVSNPPPRPPQQSAPVPPEVKRLHHLWRAGAKSRWTPEEQQDLTRIFNQQATSDADKARLLELAERLREPPEGIPL